MPAVGRAPALLVLLVLLGAAPLAGQGFFEQVTNPDARRPTFDQDFGVQLRLSRPSKDGDEIRSWRASFGLSGPVYPNPLFGLPRTLREAAAREARRIGGATAPLEGALDGEPGGIEPEPPARPSIPGGVLLSPSFDYTGLRSRSNELPRRLVTAGLNLFGFLTLDEESGLRMGTFLQARLRGDGSRVTTGDLQYLVTGFVFIPLSDEWFIVPGLGYVSDLALDFVEGLPIPSLEVVWRPRLESGESPLLVAVGVPFNILSWRPHPLFQFFALNFAGKLGEVGLTHDLTALLGLSAPEGESGDEAEHGDDVPSPTAARRGGRPGGARVTLREFFGTEADVWNLSPGRYPEKSRLFRRGLRAGATLSVSPASAVTVSGTFAWHFQRRWVGGRSQDDRVFLRRDVQAGPSFGLDLRIRF